MTLARNTSILGFATLAVLLTLGGTAKTITINKSQPAKKKCVAKEMAGLLACHAKAESKGGVVDPACLQKQKDKFDGGSKPAKGCFAKLEAKKKSSCGTTVDTTALEEKVDAFVLDAVQQLDPTYPAASLSKCGAGKKKCVGKETSGLLACHAKAELKGSLDPACLQKQHDKFDGGNKPAKGCFAKLEAKKKSVCLTTGDTAALDATIDAFVDDVVCALDPSEGTCSGGCPMPPGFGGGETPKTATSASATITDLSGTPISHVLTVIGGINIFSAFQFTGADGTVTINSGGIASTFLLPSFRFGDGLTYPLLAIPLTTATTAFGSLATAPLPIVGAPLVAGASATSGGVSVAIPPTATVTIDSLTYDTPDKQSFRAVALPIAQEAAVVDPSGLGLELLFGVAPVGTGFCPPAAITVPNGAAWPAGSAVEFHLLGTDVSQQWAPFAGWAKISDGQVSADGLTVSTSADGGFPFLGAAFGIRKKP